MPTTKLKIDLPARAELVAGLDARTCHPALVKAEQAVADAERALARCRAELAEHERLVGELPARVQRGEVKASALADGMRQRDGAALLVGAADDAFGKARVRQATEEKAGKLAADREFSRRVAVLEKAAAELSPVLEELSDLAAALASTQGPGVMLNVDWPASPADGVRLRGLLAGIR
ncbi:MAG: hypothetical protein ABI467_28870 [Kofleriaceae bacterium]